VCVDGVDKWTVRDCGRNVGEHESFSVVRLDLEDPVKKKKQSSLTAARFAKTA
jgi:hypothetical protein